MSIYYDNRHTPFTVCYTTDFSSLLFLVSVLLIVLTHPSVLTLPCTDMLQIHITGLPAGMPIPTVKVMRGGFEGFQRLYGASGEGLLER